MGSRLGAFGKPDIDSWDEYNGFPACPPTCPRVQLNGMGVRTLHVSWVSSVTHALSCSSLLCGLWTICVTGQGVFLLSLPQAQLFSGVSRAPGSGNLGLGLAGPVRRRSERSADFWKQEEVSGHLSERCSVWFTVCGGAVVGPWWGHSGGSSEGRGPGQPWGRSCPHAHFLLPPQSVCFPFILLSNHGWEDSMGEG